MSDEKKLDDMTPEELRALGKDEFMRRGMNEVGNVYEFSLLMSLEALSSSLGTLQEAKGTVIALKQAEEDGELDEDGINMVRNMLSMGVASTLIGDSMALISLGRYIEKFVQANPEFPEVAPEGQMDEKISDSVQSFIDSALGGSSSESV